ncbi:MAG TPA: hypothetical protein PLL30_11490 [Candidatus Krumholzibacteria bacterium]|nr:hypothetical protein [Candidatus Krumholzibacteria bacterium]HPD72388.1 hypothetical protein [Candidatus Krumholzibacteria bacterium]HRY40680.1 hypothetical protein [Candidatus Krumholzibacteria bacterium]
MTEPRAWERFFDAHAPSYDENVFAKNTLAEVDFLLAELALAPGAAILDVGCGPLRSGRDGDLGRGGQDGERSSIPERCTSSRRTE